MASILKEGSASASKQTKDAFLTLEKLYLELIYLLKGGSEFDRNYIFMKVN